MRKYLIILLLLMPSLVFAGAWNGGGGGSGAPLASPTFTGTVTTPALTISGGTFTGTQCLEEVSGVVTVTGSTCGGGSTVLGTGDGYLVKYVSSPNALCTGSTTPYSCCTGSTTGTCTAGYYTSNTLAISDVNMSSGTLEAPNGTGSASTTAGGVYYNTSTKVFTVGDGSAANALQVNLGLIAGTMTNGYLCTYTSSGTLLACNTNPASYASTTSPAFTTDIHAVSAGGATLGTPALPFSSIYLGGSATYNFQITGTSAAARIVNIPDIAATGYIPLLTATGTTAGQIPMATAVAGKYTNSTPTYPSASGTSRKILVSDGTNNIYSTETYAVPGTAGNTMISDGTNWTATTPQINIDCHAGCSPTAAQLIQGATLDNYGMAGASSVTVPTAGANMSFIATLGTAYANTFTLAFGSAIAYLDGGAAVTNIISANPTVIGSYMTCFTFHSGGASTYKWICKTGAGTWTNS